MNLIQRIKDKSEKKRKEKRLGEIYHETLEINTLAKKTYFQYKEGWFPLIQRNLTKIITNAENKKIITPGTKVLELGSGTGSSSIIWAHNNYNVTGIEISEEHYDIAEKKMKELHKKSNCPGTMNFVKGSYFEIKPEQTNLKEFDIFFGYLWDSQVEPIAELFEKESKDGALCVIVSPNHTRFYKSFEKAQKDILLLSEFGEGMYQYRTPNGNLKRKHIYQ